LVRAFYFQQVRDFKFKIIGSALQTRKLPGLAILHPKVIFVSEIRRPKMGINVHDNLVSAIYDTGCERRDIMTLRITVDIFSGRENPVVELEGDEERDAIGRLSPVKRLTDEEIREPAPPVLGYRGLLIEQRGDRGGDLPDSFRLVNGELFGRDLFHRAADENFEAVIFSKVGPTRVEGTKVEFPLPIEEVHRLRELRLAWPLRPGMLEFHPLHPIGKCACGPLYEPTWWNVPQRQPFNNCYNYATNYRTNTFAQPGRAAGAMYTQLSCSSVRPAAVADELKDLPGADNECPDEGHLVALVVWPAGDYHWYRKNQDGSWSHKPGSTAATNLDNSGAPITDPRTADRGPYTDFCTFMTVMHGHINIA
jgi:hypothetical protein